MSAPTGWPELLSAALLGTDRRAVVSADGVDDAAELLDAAAAWSVYRRAGAPALSGVEAPAPAPPESRPVVPPAAAARLTLLAAAGGPYDGGTRAALLAEWLELAAVHGQRVPPELLPDLFDLSRFSPAVRPLVRAAGGARVGWLAAQNPDWARLFPPVDGAGSDGAGSDGAAAKGAAEVGVVWVDERDWHHGSRAQRWAHLVARRREDPAAAVALVDADWGSMPLEERLDLLAVLADRLGPGDEAFLERALNDRRTVVRRRVADLLGALPGSELNRRMAVRAHSYLHVEDGRLTITPPAERDAAMARDGVGDPPEGAPPRAWWLAEVLGRTPLAAVTDLPPAQFLALSTPDEWRPVLHRALAQAAARQKNPQWAAVLLDEIVGAGAGAGAGADPGGLTAMLYQALGHDEQIRRAMAALSGPAAEWVAALERCPGPWPDELARAVLAAWERAVAAAEPAGGGPAVLAARQLTRSLDRLSRLAGQAMAPTLAAAAVAVVRRLQDAAAPDARLDPLAWVASVLNFRHQMAQEIQETA